MPGNFRRCSVSLSVFCTVKSLLYSPYRVPSSCFALFSFLSLVATRTRRFLESKERTEDLRMSCIRDNILNLDLGIHLSGVLSFSRFGPDSSCFFLTDAAKTQREREDDGIIRCNLFQALASRWSTFRPPWTQGSRSYWRPAFSERG